MTAIKTIALTALVLAMLGIAFLPYAVQADRRHESVTNTTFLTVHKDITIVQVHKKLDGVALGIASSGASCDSATRKNQVAVGVGSYDGSEAIFFRGCKSIGSFTINGGAGSEDGSTGYGMGASFKF